MSVLITQQGGTTQGMNGGWAVPPTEAHLNSISIEYTHQDLQEATDSFQTSNQLGVGTYGSVYKGVLRDGTEVAIKCLAQPKEQGFREEVEVLSKFRHPNLVILMGFARHNRERYLVLELLSGGDVYGRLQGPKEYGFIHRLGTALDASLGLSHLHFSRPQVFHRDIKTQNILLDKNGTAKMADFGLAVLAQPGCDARRVEHVSGTEGYADPLYIRTSVVTEKSEVYSFGMVMLELLTGKPPAQQDSTGRTVYKFLHLLGDIRNVFPMVDQRARWPQKFVVQFGYFAMRCIHESEAQRPNFREVVETLRRWFREAEADRDAEPAIMPGRQPAVVPGTRPIMQLQPAQGHHDGGMHSHNPSHVGGSAGVEQPIPHARAAAAAKAAKYIGQWVQIADCRLLGPVRPTAGVPAEHAQILEIADRPPQPGSQQPDVQPSVPSPMDARSQQGVATRPGGQQVSFQPAGQSGTATKGPSEKLLATVMDMGFTKDQAMAGLKRCSTADAAVEWIIEHGA